MWYNPSTNACSIQHKLITPLTTYTYGDSPDCVFHSINKTCCNADQMMIFVLQQITQAANFINSNHIIYTVNIYADSRDIATGGI